MTVATDLAALKTRVDTVVRNLASVTTKLAATTKQLTDLTTRLAKIETASTRAVERTAIPIKSATFQLSLADGVKAAVIEFPATVATAAQAETYLNANISTFKGQPQTRFGQMFGCHARVKVTAYDASKDSLDLQYAFSDTAPVPANYFG